MQWTSPRLRMNNNKNKDRKKSEGKKKTTVFTKATELLCPMITQGKKNKTKKNR